MAFSWWLPDLVMTLCCFQPAQPKLLPWFMKIWASYTHIYYYFTHIYLYFTLHSDSDSLRYSNTVCSKHQATEYTAFSVWYLLPNFYSLWMSFSLSNILYLSQVWLSVVLCAPIASRAPSVIALVISFVCILDRTMSSLSVETSFTISNHSTATWMTSNPFLNMSIKKLGWGKDVYFQYII